MQNFYPEVNPKPSFPQIEREVLDFWESSDIFRASVDGRSTENQFVFYDGPPFANGLPHYGHLVTGYVKDIIPRYKTLQGKRVERRFGWDCHGLPAEMEAEKDLGITGRASILEYGIEKFNLYCRTSVLKYTKEWEEYVTRQARWVDFKNDYKTMDLTFMESVIWAFKQLWDKGLIYESYRVVPYSWAAESVLSNFETRLDNSFRQRQDPAVTAVFTLNPLPNEEIAIKLLVWTTTPWTLPSNLALAVGADINYAVMELNHTLLVIAEDSLCNYEPELVDARRVGSLRGRDLVGRQYQPIFPFFEDVPAAFRVLEADFVNTDEGTGIVHIAPGFGEDDQILCQKHGISLVCPVDNSGRFTNEVSLYAGKLVFDANKDIVKDLKKQGLILRHETYLHNYPHCWRTDQPLIYRAVNSWYLRVTDIREQMIEMNNQINWVPDHIKHGLFGKWLEGAKDWSISRNRFWGTPVPIWKSDNPDYPRIDVYGSLDEIERDFGVRPTDLHRPFIDHLVRPNPDDPTGHSMMRRVDEIFDCWFESGSMPFAQVHYPFENQDWFDHHYPGDFIVEYIAQTRGWFYTLIVLSTALFNKPPFLNCMCHGVVRDENGQKLSKRLRNYPDPREVFQTKGTDALRWFLVSSPILRGGDLLIDREGKGIGEVIRLVINPIWNAYYFFCLYANADGVKAKFRTDQADILDRYILSKTYYLIAAVETLMNNYQISEVCVYVTSFVDVLNNWYIRRSRDRFWKSLKDQDKDDAYDTLFTVLTTLCQVASPLLPCISENIYKGLTGEKSVHLMDWPNHHSFPSDTGLIEDMDYVRDICSTALSLREETDLRIRLPLASLTLIGDNVNQALPYISLIKDEINVKTISFISDTSKFGKMELKVKGSVGARLKREMPKVLLAAKEARWRLLDDGRVEIEGYLLEPDEFTVTIRILDGIAGKRLDSHQGIVILDTNITPELEYEGMARDLVRLIQMSRRDANLDISDRIALALNLPAELTHEIEKHEQYICNETLSNSLIFVPHLTDFEYSYKYDFHFRPIEIAFSLIAPDQGKEFNP
jgi:isoleucyl-tRNA synthetase